MKKLLIILLAVCLCASFISCSRRASSANVVEGDISTHPKVTLRFGSIEAPDDLFSVAAYKFVDLVKEKTKGTVTIEFFPGSQLGDFPRMFEAVKLGTQDMTGGSGSYMSQFVPDKAIETAFFLFENEQHFLNYVNSDLCKQLGEDFVKATGVIPLSQTWIRGARYFVSKKPLRTAADFRGASS